MSASQNHGFEIERIILADMGQRSRLSKKVPLTSSHVSRFDAPGYSDPYAQGIPTQIKTAKKTSRGALVCLADATRIGQLADVPKTRLLVALYEQKGNKKEFSEIREYILTAAEWNAAIGGVSAEVLQMFNAAIKVKDTTAARQVAKSWKAQLAADHPSAMRWNAKIDRKGQRRLQCSIHLADLEKLVKDRRRIRVFGRVPGATAPRLWGNGTTFPIVLSSPPRVRQAKPAVAPVPASAPTRAPRRVSNSR